MILTKNVEIKVTYKTYKHYKDKGYNSNLNKIINVKVEDLTKHSHAFIDVICDKCGSIKNMKYFAYNLYSENNIYNCNKCNGEKRKKTCMKKYGLEYVSQVNSFKNKIKETSLDKYGVDNPSKSEIVKDKIKKVSLDKYGTDNPSKSKIIKDRIKETNLERYGVDNVYQSEIIKDRIKETNLERYGVYHPMQSETIKEKLKQTFLNNFGVDNPNKSEIILEKSKNTRIRKGYQIADSDLTEWQIYRREIKIITRKNKKELFDKWNGFDYYDNEYIMNNKLYKNKNYPTIDHIISIHFGFNNNISPEIIGNLNNLCITKKSINSSKNRYMR